MDFFDSYGGKSSNKDDIKPEFKRNRISAASRPVPMTNSGGAMLIIIFVTLCLTVFGFLAFSTAFADRKLTDKNIKNQVEFYSADSLAELRIAEIYNSLYTADDTLDMDALAEKIGGLDFIAEGGGAFYDSGLGALTVDFITGQDANHAIYTRADFYINQDGKWEYKIRDWYTFLTEELNYDQKFDVWSWE